MKSLGIQLAVALATAATTGETLAQSFAFSGAAEVGGNTIPDNNAAGLASVLTISGAPISIQSLSIHLEVSGGYNGDLYAYVEHAGVLGVLLNRVGRSASNPDGYLDSGFDVDFTVGAVAPDIHRYRLFQDPAGGAVTGQWQADARAIDPSLAVDSSPRTAGMGPLLGKDPNGDWVLFVADLAPAGEAKLVRWSVEGVAVPEPGEWTTMAAAGLAAFAVWRRRKR